MWDGISLLFDTSDFPARWYCGQWSSVHGWRHIVSDLLVFGAYAAIPVVLAYFVRTLSRIRPGNRGDHVSDGDRALARLRQEEPYAGRPRPDVILLDLRLKRMDSSDGLSEIKSDPEIRPIPVVVLTTSDAEADRARAGERGAERDFVKPGDFREFRRLARDLDGTRGCREGRPAGPGGAA